MALTEINTSARKGVVNQILGRFCALTSQSGWTAEAGDTSLLLSLDVTDLEAGRQIVAQLTAQFGDARFDRFRLLAVKAGSGARVEVFGRIYKIAEAINICLPQAPIDVTDALAA
ncbi:MAG: hypothetical protein J0L97_06385 [Alphaproteobacteria bacterium]|nr:hypothetical protein [Alphaproteobacteria bacterium]